MKHEHSWCASCAVVFSRQLIDRAGTTKVMLEDGEVVADLRCAAVNGLLTVLVRNSNVVARRLADKDDVVAQVTVTDVEHPAVSLRLYGWLQAVEPDRQRVIADAFAERHLTTDLLDVGVRWSLLQLDVAEAQLHHDETTIVLGPEQLQLALSLFGQR